MKLTRLIFNLLLVFYSFFAFPQSNKLDIEKQLHGKNYKQQVAIYDSLVSKLAENDYATAIAYKSHAIDLAFENKDELLAAEKLTDRSKIYKKLKEYEKMERDILTALPIVTKNNNDKLIQYCYFDLGFIKYRKGVLNGAMDNFLKALEIAEKQTKDSLAMVSLNNNIGNVLLTQGDFDKAVFYYEKAFQINKSKGNLRNAALTKDNIAIVYLNKGDFVTAQKMQQEALTLMKETNDKKALAELYMNIGAVNNELGNLDVAMQEFKTGYDLAKECNDLSSLVGCAINMADINRKKKNYNEAIKLLQDAYQISMQDKSITNLKAATQNLFETYEAMNDMTNALRYYKEFSHLKDSVLNLESINQINELAARHQTAEKEKEIEILTKDKQLDKIQLEKKNTLNIFLIVIVTMVIITLSLVFYRYKEKQKANTELHEKNEQITEQKALVEEKNKEITDSINYAKRIQQALLVPKEIIQSKFNEAFIIYHPKDIVSGDFYWYAESATNKIIAVADCTGHGVPGGFMSMLGYEMLQDVLLKENITTTNEALRVLDIKITDTLNKTTKNVRDGMEMALCAFSKTDNVLIYSGANRVLIQISNGVLIEHLPDKSTLGGNVEGYDKTYTQHEIKYTKGDVFYMYTDGYADQFGGPKHKKFMTKQLKELLLSISNKSLNEQEKILNQAFFDWKGTLEQVDDVTLIGIRV